MVGWTDPMSRAPARDLALQTLVLALEQEPALAPEDARIAFLRARPHAALARLGDRLACEQDFKAEAEALEAAGFVNAARLDGKFSLVLLLPDRQKDRTLADLARGMDLLEEGGTLLAALHNDWGARRFERLLGDLAGGVHTLSKNHCRAFWAGKSATVNRARLEEWRALGAVRRVEATGFWSMPGLFSWDEIDPGSRLLTEHLPTNLRGRVADLGCGWGFLSAFILRRFPKVRSLEMFDADRAALECARRNVEEIGALTKVELHWADVTAGVGSGAFDFVVMNAPFHEGRQPDPELGLRFIAAATMALKDQGELWMVANRHLPYERQLAASFPNWSIVAQTKSFKVLRATRERATREED